jgi:predicted acyl esterase
MAAEFMKPPGPPTAGIAQHDPFFGYDRPETHGVHLETIHVPMRDGSYLVCDLHRPADPDGSPAPGPFPGIVYEFNGYAMRQVFGITADFFTKRGYVVAIASVRGTGGTPGQVNPFGIQEQHDDYDLIEWLAAQDFCTGDIGQMGLSYAGHLTLLSAVLQPPHLRAIIPQQAISDWYENTIYRGGIPNAQIRTWQQDTAPETLDTYPQHPTYDDFWRERSVKPRWDKLTVPVLDVGGWLDPYRDGMVQNFQAREANTWMVAGPWEHGMINRPDESISCAGYLAWWDHWLLGLPAPLPAARVTSYEMPDGGWQQYETWPPAQSTTLRWCPCATGELGSEPIEKGVAEFDVRAGQLAFDSTPLAEDLVIVGGLDLRTRIAFDAQDGQVTVILDDLDFNGGTRRISNGWLKASHRNGNERPEPVEPGEFAELTVPMWPTHHRIVAGHRLRLTISSNDYPLIQRTPHRGVATVDLAATTLGASVLR